MCGLVGIVGNRDVAAEIYDALTMLQHRGQDAAGIMTCQQGKFLQRKGEGLVRDVFRSQHMSQLFGALALAMFATPPRAVPVLHWPNPFTSILPTV